MEALLNLLPHLANGVALGLLFALIALGFMLIVGVMETINLAHGSLFALGMYAALFVMSPRVPWWEALPTGTRAELIRDIARIFDEAITNIDDVSSHDEKNPLIPIALRNLAAAVTRIVGQLKPLEEQARDESETSSFDQLIDNAESIIQAANKLPPPVEKKAKGKT